MILGLSGGILRPLSATRTQVIGVFNVDVRLAIVPQAIINFFTRKLTHFGFQLFRRQCAKLVGDPVYGKRMADNRYSSYECRTHHIRHHIMSSTK
jgi:hypothetical protein